MKHSTIAAAVTALLFSATMVGCGGDEGATKSQSATTQPAFPSATTMPASGPPKNPLSYALGVNVGQTIQALSRQSDAVNQQEIMEGLQDALSGRPLRMTNRDIQQTLAEFQRQQQQMARTRMARMAEENKKQGQAFLEANAKKEGVTVLPSGLQYKVLRAGTGRTPKATDNVKVQYHGALINGTVFDSSYKRGVPARFNVSKIIPGWTEALQLMKEGDKWTIYVPSELAYGPEVRPPHIGPNSTLVFDVELLEVLTPASSQPAAATQPAPATQPAEDK
jgi:FKBP-type peptidyl-prolyl cis-trans isomerase